MASSNLAYDLSLYAEKPKETRAAKAPPLKMVRAVPRAFAAAFTPRILAVFTLVVTLISLIVYNQVCLNEVTGEISQLNQELAIMESESIRYASLLESTVSLRAVAQQAEDELGMARLDQFQTTHVYLYKEDQIILSESPEAPGESAGVLAAMSEIIDMAKEYIGGK